MASPSRRRGDRFKWWNSDRSGFQFGFQPITERPNAYTRESGRPIKDRGSDVSPEEFDTPPLSKVSLGGEGDIGDGQRANSDFTTANAYIIPPESTKVIVYTSGQVVTWNTKPWVYVGGSNIHVTAVASPQVAQGSQSQQITLLCIGSNITFINGSGLTLNTSRYVMSSGSILNLFYSSTDNTWHETSRGSQFGDLGAL